MPDRKKFNRVNKSDLAVIPDGTGYYDRSPAAAGSFVETTYSPGMFQAVASATDMTGAVPAAKPKMEFPDYDNFANPGLK